MALFYSSIRRLMSVEPQPSGGLIHRRAEQADQEGFGEAVARHKERTAASPLSPFA
jgi:hypothetical protein